MAWPEIDLWALQIASFGRGHFDNIEQSIWWFLSAFFRHSLEIFATIVIIGGGVLVLFKKLNTHWIRLWVFFSTNIILAPVLIVNGILKSYVGRARPFDTIEFGGEKLFTPAGQVTDQCARNCSFTSGEASLVTTVTICVIVALLPYVAPQYKRISIVIACAFTAFIASLRMIVGRHFLSDVTLSVLISCLCAIFLYALVGLNKSNQTHKENTSA